MSDLDGTASGVCLRATPVIVILADEHGWFARLENLPPAGSAFDADELREWALAFLDAATSLTDSVRGAGH